MIFVKKLFLAPLFLLAFAYTCYQLTALKDFAGLLFSLNLGSLSATVFLTLSIFITGLLFVLFLSLAQDLKLVLPIILVASILPAIFLSTPSNYVISSITLASELLIFFLINHKLKTYLTFSPSQLLSPSIKYFGSLLIIAISISFFLLTNEQIRQKGFEIPDSLVETVIKISSSAITSTTKQGYTNISDIKNQIKPEELEFLRKNPQLLREKGIDPKILENQSLKDPTKNPIEELSKAVIKDQFQNLVKPYLTWIPLAISLLLFITLNSIMYILSLFLPLLLWLIFYLFEAVGLIRFDKETREVRKIVV